MCKIGVSNCTQVIKGMATRLGIRHGAVHCAMNALWIVSNSKEELADLHKIQLSLMGFTFMGA